MENLRKCAICMENYRDPRNFTPFKIVNSWYPEKNANDCLHRFCHQCINNWMKSCLSEGMSFRCPTCRFEAIDWHRLRHWALLTKCYLEKNNVTE